MSVVTAMYSLMIAVIKQHIFTHFMFFSYVFVHCLVLILGFESKFEASVSSDHRATVCPLHEAGQIQEIALHSVLLPFCKYRVQCPYLVHVF